MATVKPLHDALLVQGDDDFSDTAFNYRDTFRFMTQRRMERQFKGVYPGPSQVMSALGQLVWIYAVVVLLVAGASVSSSKQVVVRSAVTVIGALIVVLIIAQQLRSRLLLLMAYCAVFAHATFFVVADDPGLFELARPSSDLPKQARQYTTLIILATVEALILIVYLAVYYGYPAVISREWLDLVKWYDVKRGQRANTLTYRAFTIHKGLSFGRQFVIQYTGGLDAEFRPHGFGVWKDTAYHGETLVGAWEHGIPVGPFTTREHGSGYASQQIRVAYAAYRHETEPDTMDTNPRFPADQQLCWGVARMECSVAGGFFKFLPRVDYFFTRENAPRSAQECLSTLRTPLDRVFYRDTETHEVVPASSVSSLKFHETLQPTTLSSSEKAEVVEATPEKEALVLVHGIVNSLEDSIKLCGQLFARGDFPAEIHPFAFSWPGGSSPLSYYAAKHSAEAPELASALHQCVASILDAGYTKVHFVTHSMGARVFLNTVERQTFRDLFQNSSLSSTSLATMASVTLCSPEFPLARFTAPGGTYDMLREYCPLITVYGDRWDLALRLSEFANRGWNQCAPLVHSLGCRVDSVVMDPSVRVRKSSVCMYPNEFDLMAKMTTTSPSTLAAVNRSAGFHNVASIAKSDPPPSSGSIRSLADIQICELQPASELSPAPSPVNYGTILDYDDDGSASLNVTPRVYLDVDVINTSFTDTNVGGNRHSYFRVNESIVEDIRELVVHKRRARGRAGLMREEGNIFIFLTAPKDVM